VGLGPLLLVVQVAWGVTASGTVHDAFPSIAIVGKEVESHRQIHASSFCLVVPKLPVFFLLA
jgi:hypothetical protein